jgi:hypothetical protein
MRKKSLFKRTKRKKKLEVDSKKSSFEKFKLSIKKNKVLIKTSLKKFFKLGKVGEIKKFLIMVTGYGFIINYSFHFVFGIKFSFFTLFGWGIVYYLVREEFVEWFRRLIAKR